MVKKDKTPKPPEKTGTSGIFAIIAAVIVIALVAILIFTALNGQSGYSPNFPYFQKTNGTIPLQFSNVLSQSNQQTTSQISMLAKSHISNLTEFSVAYNGSIYIQPNGLGGSIAKINSPLYLNESKFYTEIKLAMNATSIPVLGHGNIIFANLTNGSYTCTNFNATAISDANYEGVLFGTHNYNCVKSDSLVGVNFRNIAYFNFSSLQNDGLNLNYSQIYQSTYNGNPCTFIAGTIPPPQLNGTNIGTGKFQMCVSDAYYIPLSFSVYYNSNQATVYISLNETYIANYSQDSYINSLP